MATTEHISPLIPVLLSGGSGSRLWPVSRELHPKPFIRMPDGQSLLQKAYLRGTQLPAVASLITVANRELFFKMKDEFSEIQSQSRSIPVSYILEPCGRNTAPAIAAAAIHALELHGEDATLLVLAADHLISDQKAFEQTVSQAAELSKMGKLVTFGIRPTKPETGYGYIAANGNEVLRFVEKPSPDRAEEYLASGRYLWNSGMFCFTATAILREMQIYCPKIIENTKTCMGASRTTMGDGFRRLELDAESFQVVPDDSIDYAVMEKSDEVAVIPCDIGWSDIGSWTSLGDLTAADVDGNRVQGEVILRDTKNCTIQSDDRLIGTLGLDGLVIIDTADALLVANKSRVQDVKHLYAELKTKDHEAYKIHRKVHRPWGTYSVLQEGNGFKIKRIEVKPGASLSLQRHQHRSEHWVVVSGSARVVNGAADILVNVNESTFIPAGRPHRLYNCGEVPCVVIEVQTGEYLGEDDILRLQDNYGRTP